jgi:outer membrane cobalamin receptor
MNDRIVWAPQSNGFYSPENLSSVESIGLDGSVKINLMQKKEMELATLLSVNWNKNQIVKEKRIDLVGKSIVYQPKLFLSTALNFRYKSLVSKADVSYVSKRPILADNTEYLPSFIVVNYKLGYICNDNFSVIVKVNNLLNTDYQYINNYLMPLRNFEIKLNYKFL